jgi:cob(I)alamin adenosyltransferase
VGALDELNACLGICALSAEGALAILLGRAQGTLFDCGAEIACPVGSPHLREAPLSGFIAELERSIDQQSEALPPLRSFILPGGSRLAAEFHWTRTVCRRAERCLVELNQNKSVRPDVLTLMNRLSDWLFVCARTANAEAGREDVPWSAGVGA